MAGQGTEGQNRAEKSEINGDKASDRDSKGKFVAGNKVKGGRPKEYRDFKLRCREFMDTEGWDILCDIARGRGPSRIHAVKLLAAYGYGEPTQEVKMGGEAKVICEVVYVNKPANGE